MPSRFLAALLLCGTSTLALAQSSASLSPDPLAAPTRLTGELAPEVRAVLGLDPVLARLRALPPDARQSSLEALTLRQQVLERILFATFQVDDALGRIDTEASYMGEDRYVLQIHDQRQANALNLVTFATSGALGAAGAAMQLTHGLAHAGTALQAASGGSSLVLTGITLKAGGGHGLIRSPYNMLAELLDQPPNAASHYPPLVLAYLRAPRGDGQPPIAEGITTAWRRLHRLNEGKHGGGAPVADLVADRSSGKKLSSDEFADREAMLHDLHANVVLLRSRLEQFMAGLDTPGQP